MHIRMRSKHNDRSNFWSVLVSLSSLSLTTVRGIAFKIEITGPGSSLHTPMVYTLRLRYDLDHRRPFFQPFLSPFSLYLLPSVSSSSSSSSSSSLLFFPPTLATLSHSVCHSFPSPRVGRFTFPAVAVYDHTASHEFAWVRSVWRSSSTKFCWLDLPRDR